MLPTVHCSMRYRQFAIGTGFLIGSLLLSGCSQKPVFKQPSVIIDRPILTQRSSSSASFSKQSVPSASTPSKPASLLIRVPFAPQAPFAVWDALHEEACEEMSLIMVHHYLADIPLSISDAEVELQNLVSWEQKHDYPEDVDVRQLGDIAKSFYGYKIRVLIDVTADKLRQELERGNPIILPAAGRLLHNPYFSGEGPYYHMLVVIGYTGDGFITNDPGTKQGSQYWYSTDVLLNALHDWTGVKEEIATGARNALVVER